MDSIKPLTKKQSESFNDSPPYRLPPLPVSIYRRFRQFTENARLAAQRINISTTDGEELAESLWGDAEWLAASLQRREPVEWR